MFMYFQTSKHPRQSVLFSVHQGMLENSICGCCSHVLHRCSGFEWAILWQTLPDVISEQSSFSLFRFYSPKKNCVQTAKAQTSLHNCASWSGHLVFACGISTCSCDMVQVTYFLIRNPHQSLSISYAVLHNSYLEGFWDNFFFLISPQKYALWGRPK